MFYCCWLLLAFKAGVDFDKNKSLINGRTPLNHCPPTHLLRHPGSQNARSLGLFKGVWAGLQILVSDLLQVGNNNSSS